MNWIRHSPALRYAAELKKAAENDLILHNRYSDHVPSFTLPTGARMLVLKSELERDVTEYDETLIAERAGYIAWWKERLAERGARMVVLLVPDKMSVYGPSLGVKVPADPYLNRLQRELDARGVSVINGLTPLRATASADLAAGRLAYLREDQHWNALGVERLAAETAAVIKASGGQSSLSHAR